MSHKLGHVLHFCHIQLFWQKRFIRIISFHCLTCKYLHCLCTFLYFLFLQMARNASEDARQKKHGLYVRTAPQETDAKDDRKPFPGQNGNSTTTRDDPREGKSLQSQSTFKVLLFANMLSGTEILKTHMIRD